MTGKSVDIVCMRLGQRHSGQRVFRIGRNPEAEDKRLDQLDILR
jgi:hypothetical protein